MMVPVVPKAKSKSQQYFPVSESVHMMPADFTAAVARRFFDAYASLGLSCPRVGASKDDKTSAYRNVPATELYYQVTAVVNPASG